MKPSRPFSRTDRVAHEIQNILGSIQTQQIDLSYLGFITFTRVTLSPDIRNAKIFFSVVQPKKKIENIVIELNRLAKAFRKYLGNELRIKYTPELKFYFDDTLAYSQQLDEIFHNLTLQKSDSDSK